MNKQYQTKILIMFDNINKSRILEECNKQDTA